MEVWNGAAEHVDGRSKIDADLVETSNEETSVESAATLVQSKRRTCNMQESRRTSIRVVWKCRVRGTAGRGWDERCGVGAGRLAWASTVVHEGNNSGVRVNGVVHRERGHGSEDPDASKERRVCIAVRCQTEHHAAEVCDVWRHGERERGRGTGFQVAGLDRACGRCETQMKAGTDAKEV